MIHLFKPIYQLFSRLYYVVLSLAEHRYAKSFLMALSFFESFILPYPPTDVFLAPVILKNRGQAYLLAFWTTVFSVMGGLIGYFVGLYGFELLQPWLAEMGYLGKIQQATQWFEDYGSWVILLAALTPIPYKIVTITAGVLSMNIMMFIVMSFAGRALRYYLVAVLVKYYGEKCDVWLRKYVDGLGWFLIILFTGIYFYVR